MSPPLRHGKLNTLWLMLLAAGGVSAFLVGLLAWGGPGAGDDANQLSMYCAAGLRPVVQQVVDRYEREYGVKVELQFGGSNTLLNQIQVDKFSSPDLYLAADDFYTDQAVEKGLATETLPVAQMRLVICVPKGNPKQISSLDDLLRDDVATVIANPEAAAVGRAVRKRLQPLPLGESNYWQRLEAAVTERGVFKPTVNEVANDVKLGHVDAGIVFDSTAAMRDYRDRLEVVEAAELSGDPNLVTVCVLNSSRKATAALRFARFLTARDQGLPVFAAGGLRPVEGDVWAEHPQVTFYCGAVNRRAVDQIVDDFQLREGVTVNTVYDGCGVLTSRMKTIEGQRSVLGFPDVYMACDRYYLENVKQWFQEAADVSDVEIVIAVPKGRKKVQTLEDLVTPGVRVAVGEPERCTLGALTRRLLEREGLYNKLKAKQQQEGEVVVEKSSSALLVPDVVTGHVDAAVAYITDASANSDRLDIVRIESPLNLAIQPMGISKTSDHKHLLRRLFKRIAASPQAFEEAGFHFRLAESVENKE